jgi:type IV fimbrial biogenesis protein FimT
MSASITPGRGNAGLTLVELMVTVSISAILLTLAVPSFEETMRNNRLTTQSNDLVTSFNLARAEAIKRRATVSVCASSDQASCGPSASWQNGWIVRDDTNGAIIRAFPGMKGATSVTANTARVRYGQTGFLVDGATVSLTLCAGAGKPGRRIDIIATGRPNSVSPYPTC